MLVFMFHIKPRLNIQAYSGILIRCAIGRDNASLGELRRAKVPSQLSGVSYFVKITTVFIFPEKSKVYLQCKALLEKRLRSSYFHVSPHTSHVAG